MDMHGVITLNLDYTIREEEEKRREEKGREEKKEVVDFWSYMARQSGIFL